MQEQNLKHTFYVIVVFLSHLGTTGKSKNNEAVFYYQEEEQSPYLSGL